MKKITVALCFLVTAMLLLTSCGTLIVTKNIVTKDETQNLGEKSLDEGVVEYNKDEIISEQEPEKIQNDVAENITEAEIPLDEFLKNFSAVKNEEKAVDSIATGFVEALKNTDINAVSAYVGGKAEYYSFLENAGISNVEIISVDVEQKKDAPFSGWYDHCNKYLCIIHSNGTTAAFPNAESRYFLATYEYSATGNKVIFFVPFEKVVSLHNGINLPQNYRTVIDSFLDHYAGTLVLGKNDADTFDFHNVQGFHFIPHLMQYFEKTEEMPHPYSMTQINEFISNAFDGNEGIELRTWQDFDLWVSDKNTDEDAVYGEDDEIYGCFYGHGANSVFSEIESFEITDDGVTVQVNTYADLAYFTKAKSMVFYFDVYNANDTVPKLFGIDVKSDEGLEEASVSF